MAHQEDPDCANKKHQRYDNKANPVDHPGNQEPLFILLWLEKGEIIIKTDVDLNLRRWAYVKM